MSKRGKTIFQMIPYNTGSYSFNTYRNQETGLMESLTIGVRDDGLPITKRFMFKAGKRTLPIGNNEKDINGKSFVEFVRNHPACKGSPNAEGRTPTFFEVNPERDAKIILDDEQLNFEAMKIALESKGVTLSDYAAMCNQFSDNVDLQRQAVVNMAKANPQGLVDMKKAGDTKVKASIKKFINKGVVYVDGYIHYWKTEGATQPLMIGTSLEDAVSKLMADDKLMKGLNDHYARLIKK